MNVRYILLCEDEQMACFIRRFLKERNIPRHDIRELIAPAGRGSGEQWVRVRYPDELLAIRSMPGVALMVGTDADVGTVAERIASLDEECKKRGVPVRGRGEKVAILVPKRNIETWLAYLRQESVDESQCYPKYPSESDCRNDVRELERMCREQKLRDPVPPSLKAACAEFRNV